MSLGMHVICLSLSLLCTYVYIFFACIYANGTAMAHKPNSFCKPRGGLILRITCRRRKCVHFAPPLLLKLWNLSVPFPGVALIFLAVVGLFVALLLMLLRLCTALYVHEIVSGRVELIIVCDLPPEAQLHEQPTLNLLLRFGQDVRQHSSTVDT